MSGKRLIEMSVLTHDLSAAVDAWVNASGLRADVEQGEGRIAVGGVLVRLLSPDASPLVSSLLGTRGEGMYELLIEVDDLEGAVENLGPSVAVAPVVTLSAEGRREVALDPASTHGVPIRLVEKR